jgi:hypothetical protein
MTAVPGRTRVAGLFAAALMAIAMAPAAAADYYAGRTIDLLIGSPPGGG